MTAADLIKYYSALLISQYQALPKARATIEAVVGEAVADLLVTQVRDAFNLDTAVGPQLDMLGALVGARRDYHGAPIAKKHFQLAPYADWAIGAPTTFIYGFSTYGGPRQFHSFATYHDTTAPSYFLSDMDYRRMIKYVAALNTLGSSMAEVIALMSSTFGLVNRRDTLTPASFAWLPVVEVYDASEVYHSTLNPPAMDNMTMKYSYRYTPVTTGDAFITAVVYKELFPRPAGVTVTVESVDSWT